MKALHIVTFLLVAVGGLNWGLVGLGMLVNGNMEWNVVHLTLGSSMALEGGVYVLVGLATIWELISHPKMCSRCKMGGSQA
jgi:uncharacterized membrane protein YuzA (DUF378 family)